MRDEPLPFDESDEAPDFDGETYEHDRDHDRLAGLLLRVQTYMRDSEWRTLAEICQACGGTEASCSARLRDLRKKKFGSHSVERRYVSEGLWEYRVDFKDITI